MHLHNNLCETSDRETRWRKKQEYNDAKERERDRERERERETERETCTKREREKM